MKRSYIVTRAFKVVLVGCLATLMAMAGDVTGKWTMAVKGGVTVWGKTQAGAPTETATINLKADGSALTGTVTFPRTGTRNVPNTRRISNGRIDGDDIAFDTVNVVVGTQMTTHYTGKLDGDTIHFTVKTGGGAGSGNAFDAHRSKD